MTEDYDCSLLVIVLLRRQPLIRLCIQHCSIQQDLGAWVWNQEMSDECPRAKSERHRKQRLRFKRCPRHSESSRSPTTHHKSQHHFTQVDEAQDRDALDPDDEAFYSSGPAHQVEPSRAARYEEDDFTERLFDAMADDEGKDFWQEVYSQPIHDFPVQPEMTDDEYAAYVRKGMWERTHAQKADAQRRKAQIDNDGERLGSGSSARRALQENPIMRDTLETRWKVYLKEWERLGASTWTIESIPWPNIDGDHRNLNAESIEAFLSHTGSVKAIAKEELRRRWHPDRFQQKALKHVKISDQTLVLASVTNVAQILNAKAS